MSNKKPWLLALALGATVIPASASATVTLAQEGEAQFGNNKQCFDTTWAQVTNKHCSGNVPFTVAASPSGTAQNSYCAAFSGGTGIQCLAVLVDSEGWPVYSFGWASGTFSGYRAMGCTTATNYPSTVKAHYHCVMPYGASRTDVSLYSVGVAP